MRFDRRISRRSFLAAVGATSAVLALTACGGSSSSVAASSASGLPPLQLALHRAAP